MQDHTHASAQPQPYAATVMLFGLLVVVDLLFVAVHAVHVWSPFLKGGHYSMESDAGLAELYQYIKQVWLIACLAVAFLHTRIRVYVGWVVLFGYLLLDDAAQLHERAGFWLGTALGFPAVLGLRPDDLGEITVAAVIGLVAAALVVVAFRRGSPEGARHVSTDLLCLLCALALFGVAFDALHTITHFRVPAIAPVFALIEDGGEMFVVSAMTAYSFDIASNSGQLRINLWPWIRTQLARVGLQRGLAST